LFFSSRRRHTRFSRDWSSDVCSSDLGLSGPAILQISSYWQPGQTLHINLLPHLDLPLWLAEQQAARPNSELKTLLAELFTKKMRSEERRGGKECRARCAPGHGTDNGA